jgi:hypothetical protein
MLDRSPFSFGGVRSLHISSNVPFVVFVGSPAFGIFAQRDHPPLKRSSVIALVASSSSFRSACSSQYFVSNSRSRALCEAVKRPYVSTRSSQSS